MTATEQTSLVIAQASNHAAMVFRIQDPSLGQLVLDEIHHVINEFV